MSKQDEGDRYIDVTKEEIYDSKGNRIDEAYIEGASDRRQARRHGVCLARDALAAYVAEHDAQDRRTRRKNRAKSEARASLTSASASRSP